MAKTEEIPICQYVQGSPSLNKINARRNFGFDTNEAHPMSLPSTQRSPLEAIPSPYKSLYQGTRVINDTRVFRRRFAYAPKDNGHHVVCEGMFDCTITHMAIETTEGIPIILRGGAGYKHFIVVVKAKPGNELRGTVRAYCKKKQPEPLLYQPVPAEPKRRFLLDIRER